MRPKYPAIHGGADYVLPILLTQGNAPITGELVATYRVGTELVSREFSDVVDIGVVTDPTNATYDVNRYDCVISAADTTDIGADAMVRIDINLTIGERKMQALGVVVPYYAYGGPVDAEPYGEHVVVTAQRLVATVVTVLGSGGGFSGVYADLTGKPTLGTAASRDVPESGNATGTQCVIATDTRLSGGSAKDDWKPSERMFQDPEATIPATEPGQRLRAWLSPSGRKLLATHEDGMLLQLSNGLLHPYCRPDGSGINYGGLHLDGDSLEPMVVHLIMRSSAGRTENFYVTDGPGRTNECLSYGDLRAFLYDGVNVVYTDGYAALANQTLLSVTHGNTDIQLYRDGELQATNATSGFSFPLPLHILNGFAQSKGATLIDVVRISPVADLAADLIELVPLVKPKPKRRVVVISDSQFTVSFGSYEGGGISEKLTENFAVLPNSSPGNVMSNIISGDCVAQVSLFKPHFAVYCLTNDFTGGRTAAQLLDDIIANAAAIGITNPRVVTPWLRGATWGPDGEANYTAQCIEFDRLCRITPGIVLIDGYRLIVGDRLADDGVHTKPAGADAIVNALEISFNSPVTREGKLYTVATLGSGEYEGDRAYVIDSSVDTPGEALASGGSYRLWVTWDGDNWNVG